MLTETEATGFTPVPDVIADKRGLNCAAVWGIIWRYSQMETGWCSASVDTMADRLGVDRKTVMKYIDWLLRPDDGTPYIERELRPGTTARYRPTMRLVMKTALSIEDTDKRAPRNRATSTKPKTTHYQQVDLRDIPVYMGGLKE